MNSSIVHIGADHHFQYCSQVLQVYKVVVVDVVNFKHKVQLLFPTIGRLVRINQRQLDRILQVVVAVGQMMIICMVMVVVVVVVVIFLEQVVLVVRILVVMMVVVVAICVGRQMS